jgi:cytochrome o ubiquinol oxidase operon protein cyoD
MLTLAAYFTVVNGVLSGRTVIMAIAGLAIAQLLVQLVFFLHLHRETKPRLNLIVFLFMLMVVGIVVVGSLWIMENLDYTMHPHEADEYLLEEEGIH